MYVLDANAFLTLLADRVGAKRVEKIIQEAALRNSAVFMSAVTWGEVFYSVWKMRGEPEAKNLAMSIQELPLVILPVDRERAARAGELKAVHDLGYTDSFAAGLAMELAATLLTADPDFKKVGKKLKVEFLPKHESTSSR